MNEESQVRGYYNITSYLHQPGNSVGSPLNQMHRQQLNAHTPYTYVALHEVTRCMVVWCTQNAPRLTLCGSRFLWHQPCKRFKYTTSVDIQKRAIKKIKNIHSCRITYERSESARERRIALYKGD